MKEPFVWTVDFYGSLHKLHLNQLYFECLVPYNPNTRKNTFKRVSASASCVWGIGGDQNVYMLVYQTDLPILVQEHCYENERWYIGLGFSERSLLSTDRYAWSSKDGKVELRRESFYLPNDEWEWEGDWFVDKSIECDIEGWEYALDFPRQYFGYQSKSSFVRRRRWARQRKFTGFETWMRIPTMLSDDPFYDIAIGGDQIQGQSQGFLAVWAITFTGKIFFRSGVNRLCLEGKEWIEVQSDDFNLVQISVGSSGIFGGVTWDGNVVLRTGADHCHPSGKNWLVIQSPSNLLFNQVSVGCNALWAITKLKKVFFYRGMTRGLENSEDRDWVEMVGEFDLISVGPNDQVIGLSIDEGSLYVRTGVTDVEPVGREWRKLDIAEDVDVSAMCCCLDNGSCDIDTKFVESLGRCQKGLTELSITNSSTNKWRIKLLDDVCIRNEKVQEFVEESMKIFQNDSDRNENRWNKRCSCKCLVDRHYDTWVDSHLKLCSSSDAGDSHDPIFYVYYNQNSKFQEWSISLSDIVCIHRLQHAARPYSFTLLAYDNEKESVEQDVVLEMESEKLLLEWIDTLTEQISKPRTTNMVIYATTVLGDIYKCTITEDYTDFQKFRWQQVAGHLKQVSCGAAGVVWGYGFDGVPYVLSDKITLMHSDEEHVIFENQRWNPVGGFSQSLLPSDRWAWSDRTGRINCAKEGYALPSSTFRWIGDWYIVYDSEADAEGWQYAFDFPRYYHNYRGYNDYVRRRRWKRKCHVSSKGPWERITTDVRILDITLSLDDDNMSVWGVSCNGDVLYRTNVSKENPKGDSWDLVPTETPVRSISMGTKSRVWCIAQDESCYVRAGFQTTKTIGSHWLHIPRETQNIRQIAVGRNVILALDSQGCVYMRQDVTDNYPEGTSWGTPVWENVTNISVNRLDQVSFVQNGDVMVCLDVRNMSSKVSALLKDGWEGVCYRGIYHQSSSSSPIQDSPDDVEKEEGETSSLTSSESFTTTPVDPYSVDIYSYYGK